MREFTPYGAEQERIAASGIYVPHTIATVVTYIASGMKRDSGILW